jgi:hypothetical protein
MYNDEEQGSNMITANDITARVHERPFQPLRIVTSAGQAFDVFHPDLIMVGRRTITIGTIGPHHPTHYEGIIQVSILHITSIENLPNPAPPHANGEA